MKRKRSDWPPPEVEAVLRASSKLKPCKKKYACVPDDAQELSSLKIARKVRR